MLATRAKHQFALLLCLTGAAVFSCEREFAQAVPAAAPAGAAKDYEFTCPGSFPSDLTIVNCRYLARQRLLQFVTTGVSDQAMLESAAGSVFTLLLKTPGEWPRTWEYYGYRVGASYTQSLGSATAELIVGAIVHDDPRHVSCDSDPLLFGKDPAASQPFTCSQSHRFGHALLDSITVRSSGEGTLSPSALSDLGLSSTQKQYKSRYHRLPAFSRLVGAYAGAYAQYPWEPGSANRFGAISQRAALSFAPTFLGSFYTEYSPSIFSRLKRAKK